MTPEGLHVVVLDNIIRTTLGTDMKKVGDYLNTESETFERFAWLPRRMSNDKLVWFEKYIEIRYYADLFGRPPIKNNYYTVYFTPEDHTINLLKGNPFKPTADTKFTGHPINNIHSHRYYKNQ